MMIHFHKPSRFRLEDFLQKVWSFPSASPASRAVIRNNATVFSGNSAVSRVWLHFSQICRWDGFFYVETMKS